MTGRTRPLDHVPGLRELARSQHGVARRAQLGELGIDRDHVRSQVAARRWQTLGPQVVVLTTGTLTRAQQMYAGWAHVGPDGRLAGFTTLEQLGLRGLFLEAEREGETEAARQYAERALGLNPKLAWSADALFELQCRQNDWPGALETLSLAKRHGQIEKPAQNPW